MMLGGQLLQFGPRRGGLVGPALIPTAAPVAAASRPLDPTFTPPVPGYALWCLADYGTWQDTVAGTRATADGDPVHAWQDFSGNANHPTGTATLKLAIQNGKPVLRFNGSSDTLRAAFSLPQPHTRFLVARDRGPLNGGPILCDGHSSGEAYMVWGDPSNPGHQVDTILAGTPYFEGSIAADHNWHIWTAIYNAGSSGVQIDANAMDTGTTGSQAATGITLAADGTPLLWDDCDIAEVIAYPAALNSTDIASVLSYLNTRWGIY